MGSRLSDLRGAFPECRVVLFADISAGLALATSAEQRPSQEHLDALCTSARAAFEAGHRVPEALGAEEPMLDIVAADARRLLVITRSETQPDDALICECSHAVDVAGLMSRARADLAEIADAG